MWLRISRWLRRGLGGGILVILLRGLGLRILRIGLPQFFGLLGLRRPAYSSVGRSPPLSWQVQGHPGFGVVLFPDLLEVGGDVCVRRPPHLGCRVVLFPYRLQ